MDESLINNYTQTDILSSDQPENKMPQNIEAEQSLIGSILFDNKVLEDLDWRCWYFLLIKRSSLVLFKGKVTDSYSIESFRLLKSLKIVSLEQVSQLSR